VFQKSVKGAAPSPPTPWLSKKYWLTGSTVHAFYELLRPLQLARCKEYIGNMSFIWLTLLRLYRRRILRDALVPCSGVPL
jgi:hypothetical protein